VRERKGGIEKGEGENKREIEGQGMEKGGKDEEGKIDRKKVR
jgi:hypothetical protein